MRVFSLISLIALTACTPAPQADVTMNRPDDALQGTALPAMQSFASGVGAAPQRSNTAIAADILDLTFRMESGRTVPVLSRFDGPVTVSLVGDVPPTARPDLARLIGRFRNEAGIDVRMGDPGKTAAITIEFQPRAVMQRVVPNAACFVVPRVSSWAEYRAKRNTPAVDWGTLVRRDRVAIFVPSDTSPQEVRDCLHEETAQAMGPLNDLYRLADSVFNDDNFNTVLTGFDMLVLRTIYAPDLRTGMNEAEVAVRLPALLSRLNPAGNVAGRAPDARVPPRSWTEAVQAAFSSRSGDAARRAAANRMLAIARAQGWQDNRLAFSQFAVGRTAVANDPMLAETAYLAAGRLYRSLPGGQVHAAHVDMQLAAFALSTGRFDRAITLADSAIPVVTRAENAALLATLLLIKSEALAATGHDGQARAAYLDSLGWARYGFGSDKQVRARMSEIAALAARGKRG
ncbi:MAG: DUF2927 domain-containing protein [Pseudomonadota bacterium]